jgi:hypothetical protein
MRHGYEIAVRVRAVGHFPTNRNTTMNPQSLPPSIESQLSELEMRHKFHQIKMEDQKEAKHIARERHRQGWHKRRLAPIHLCHP